MSYKVTIRACLDHDDCSEHACIDDETGVEVWTSHAPDHLDDLARLNVTHPDAIKDGEPVRWHAPSPVDAEAMGWPPDVHRMVAALGVVVGTRTLDEVVERSGFTADELVTEAKSWAPTTVEDRPAWRRFFP